MSVMTEGDDRHPLDRGSIPTAPAPDVSWLCKRAGGEAVNFELVAGDGSTIISRRGTRKLGRGVNNATASRMDPASHPRTQITIDMFP